MMQQANDLEKRWVNENSKGKESDRKKMKDNLSLKETVLKMGKKIHRFSKQKISLFAGKV